MELELRTFDTPEGIKLTFRENTGADEEILSRASKAKDLLNIPEYLARVIVTEENPLKPAFTVEEILKWRIGQKYYALLCARVHSLGTIMKFKYTYPKSKEPKVLSQDLAEFMIEQSGLKFRYAGLSQREFTLKSGKVVRYNFLNTHGEKYALNIEKDRLAYASIQLLQRGLEWFNGQEFIVVSDFSIFSSRDMNEIRSDIKASDIDFYPLIQVLDLADSTKLVDELPLLMMDSFFYPEEIL